MWQWGQSSCRQNTEPIMHQWRFSTLDSDRHTWLPRSRGQACKPADPDTAGEPRKEQRRYSKVRYSAAQPAWMLLSPLLYVPTFRPWACLGFPGQLRCLSIILYTLDPPCLQTTHPRSTKLVQGLFLLMLHKFSLLPRFSLLTNIWILLCKFCCIVRICVVLCCVYCSKKKIKIMNHHSLSFVNMTVACQQNVKQLFVCCALLYPFHFTLTIRDK